MRTAALLIVACLLAGTMGTHAWTWTGHGADTADCDTIVDVAVAGNFTILAQALAAANLTDVFSDPTLMVTVFAPTDDAFLSLIAALDTTAEDLLANNELLTSVLTTHVVDGLLGLEAWQVPSLNANQPLVISPYVGASNWAQITVPGVRACRSIVYPIDQVLLPGNATESTSSAGRR